MAKKATYQQQLLIDDGSPLAKACDDLIVARDAFEDAKKDKEKKVGAVIVEMEKVRRTSVKHVGRIFSIRQSSPKATVAIKE